MHANLVFDRINLGEDRDFLHWLADAGGHQLDPGKDFSQGQRQDLALALFLALAVSAAPFSSMSQSSTSTI
jgi:exonuclease SbcC